MVCRYVERDLGSCILMSPELEVDRSACFQLSFIFAHCSHKGSSILFSKVEHKSYNTKFLGYFRINDSSTDLKVIQLDLEDRGRYKIKIQASAKHGLLAILAINVSYETCSHSGRSANINYLLKMV